MSCSTQRGVRRACSRFRDGVQGDDKALWERKGEGIVPLSFDTTPVKNIAEHRHVSLSISRREALQKLLVR